MDVNLNPRAWNRPRLGDGGFCPVCTDSSTRCFKSINYKFCVQEFCAISIVSLHGGVKDTYF